MTIKDIAKLSGVGVGTVSRILNNHPYVNPETKARILKIMEEHNYIPNDGARALKKSSTDHVGLLVTGYSELFYSVCIPEIIHDIEERNWINVLQYTKILDIKGIHSFIKKKKLRGLICLGGYLAEEQIQQLENIEVPIVFMSTQKEKRVESPHSVFLDVDDVHASEKMGTHLIQLGHRSIGLITFRNMNFGASSERIRGFEKALQRFEDTQVHCYIQQGGVSYQDGFDAAEKLLKQHPEITAIYAFSDVLAMGALKALHQNGILVPQEVAIAGFDGLEMSDFTHPSLTTIAQPSSLMAQKAIQILFEKMENSQSIDHGDLLLPGKLLIRESTEITTTKNQS